MIVAVCAVQFGWNIWLAHGSCHGVRAAASASSTAYLVLRTGLPSFIVTLGTLFIVRGATIGVNAADRPAGRRSAGWTRRPASTAAKALFASNLNIGGALFLDLDPVVAGRRRVGDLGPAADLVRQLDLRRGRQRRRRRATSACRSTGSRSCCSWRPRAAACLVAMIQAMTFTGADVLRGTGKEFYAIIAVVVGGTLLTGGYGSAIGAVLGALIFGMVKQGIVFARVDADWFQVVLGAMLLIAVLVNRFVRDPRDEGLTHHDHPARAPPLIEVQNISKYFGNVIALRGRFDDAFYPGEVMCLLGDNGAGKSTLIKILSGVHQPDARHATSFEGRDVRFASPRDALDVGHRHRLSGPGDDPADEHLAQFLSRLGADASAGVRFAASTSPLPTA